MKWLPNLTNEQNIRLDSILARRDGCLVGRYALTIADDAESFAEIRAIALDDAKSPDDLLDALDTHVATLEKKQILKKLDRSKRGKGAAK